MRVAHLVPALFGTDGIVGGAERYAYELARHMAEVIPTTLDSFGERSREEQVGPLSIRVIGHPWFVRGQRANPFSPEVFRTLRVAEVIHCHQQHVLTSSTVAAWLRVSGRRVFVSDLGGGGWDISAYVSTDRWFHGHLHLSQYSRRIAGHEHDTRAHVIGGGVDVQKFSPASVHRGSGALFVGRLLPHKGVDDLIRGLPEGMPLTIVGPRPDQECWRYLSDLAKGRDVTFFHDLDDEALVREYRRALCVVLPSVYRTADGRFTAVPELLGQTLLEGMACGSPVVCTRVASMPEVVDHGVTGFVVPPNDPSALADRLAWLRDNPEAARRMGAAARHRILRCFTWPAVVTRCLELYEAAASRSQERLMAPSGAQ